METLQNFWINWIHFYLLKKIIRIFLISSSKYRNDRQKNDAIYLINWHNI